MNKSLQAAVGAGATQDLGVEAAYASEVYDGVGPFDPVGRMNETGVFANTICFLDFASPYFNQRERLLDAAIGSGKSWESCS